MMHLVLGCVWKCLGTSCNPLFANVMTCSVGKLVINHDKPSKLEVVLNCQTHGLFGLSFNEPHGQMKICEHEPQWPSPPWMCMNLVGLNSFRTVIWSLAAFLLIFHVAIAWIALYPVFSEGINHLCQSAVIQ